MKQRMTIAQLAWRIARGDRSGPWDRAFTDLMLKAGLIDRPVLVNQLGKIVMLEVLPMRGYHAVTVYDLLPASGQRKTIEVEVPDPVQHPDQCQLPVWGIDEEEDW